MATIQDAKSYVLDNRATAHFIPSSVAVFAAFYTPESNGSGAVTEFYYKPCHGFLAGIVDSWTGKPKYPHLALATHFFSTIPPRSFNLSQEEAETYWEFIFDKDKSPWRKLFDDKLERFVDKAGVSQAFCIGVNPETHADFFVDFCIATREPFENPGCVRFWYYLVKKGFTEVEALAAASRCHLSSTNKTLQGGDGISSHHPFNPYDLVWHRLRDGNPNLNFNPRKQRKLLTDGYDSPSSVWREYNKDSRFTLPLIKAVVTAYNGVFKSFMTKLGVITRDGNFRAQAGYCPEATTAEWMKRRDELFPKQGANV